MEQEHTTEESDKLIRQELWLADDDSTLNIEEEETEETLPDDSEEELEEETEEELEDEEQEEEQEEASKPRKKSRIEKVLSQRNEARREAEDALTQVQQLQERLDELDAEGNYGNEEYVQTLVDKRIAETQEKNDFFDENDIYKPYKKDILWLQKQHWLWLQQASKLYLAENHPELLVEKQTINKQKAKMYQTQSLPPKKLDTGQFNFSDEEFDRLAKAGKIQF